MSKVNPGFVAPLFCALLMTGCVTSGNVAMKEQTQQFGSADAVSFTDSGNEVWTYRHSKSKPMARNFIPYNFFSLGDNTKTKELVILFDTKGVVTNYTFRETANQSKYGVMQ